MQDIQLTNNPQTEYEARCKFIREAFNSRYLIDILRRELFHRQSGICRLCDKPLHDSSSFFASIDHGFSISHFGKSVLPLDEAEDDANHIDNLYAVHPPCNSAKNDMNIDEWDAGSYKDSLKQPVPPDQFYKTQEIWRKKLSERQSTYLADPVVKARLSAQMKSRHSLRNKDGKSAYAVSAGKSSVGKAPKDSLGRPLSLMKAVVASQSPEAIKKRADRMKGTKRSNKSRHKQSTTLKSKFAGKPVPHLNTPEARKKIAAAKLGKPGKPWTDSQRQKLIAAVSGEKNHFYGKTHTKEVLERMSRTKLNKQLYVAEGVSVNNFLRPKVISEKLQKQIRRLFVGRFHTDEWKKAMSDKMKHRVFTPLHRQRLSAANEVRFLKTVAWG